MKIGIRGSTVSVLSLEWKEAYHSEDGRAILHMIRSSNGGGGLESRRLFQLPLPPLFLDSLPVLVRARGVVDESKFKEGTENEGQADSGPNVEGLGVGDWGEGLVDTRGLCGHGEEGSYAKGDTGRNGTLVEPKGDPRHDD